MLFQVRKMLHEQTIAYSQDSLLEESQNCHTGQKMESLSFGIFYFSMFVSKLAYTSLLAAKDKTIHLIYL